ncbi:MAG: hypothetical protein MUO62_12040, partial [Anaerolineales bacterium]|nr:hypothetical protein [Anaerolineales bacterium]
MKALNRIRRHPNIHPLLTGFFPPLFLLAHNIVEIPFKDGHRSILIIAIGIVGLLLTLNLILKNQTKAALITTLLIVLFFSYNTFADYGLA